MEYTKVVEFQSQHSGKIYTIKRSEKQAYSCDCMAWIYGRGKDENGHCKHIRSYIELMGEDSDITEMVLERAGLNVSKKIVPDGKGDMKLVIDYDTETVEYKDGDDLAANARDKSEPIDLDKLMKTPSAKKIFAQKSMQKAIAELEDAIKEAEKPKKKIKKRKKKVNAKITKIGGVGFEIVEIDEYNDKSTVIRKIIVRHIITKTSCLFYATKVPRMYLFNGINKEFYDNVANYGVYKDAIQIQFSKREDVPGSTISIFPKTADLKSANIDLLTLSFVDKAQVLENEKDNVVELKAMGKSIDERLDKILDAEITPDAPF